MRFLSVYHAVSFKNAIFVPTLAGVKVLLDSRLRASLEFKKFDQEDDPDMTVARGRPSGKSNQPNR